MAQQATPPVPPAITATAMQRCPGTDTAEGSPAVCSLVTGVRIGAEEELDVIHGGGEAGEPFLFIIEQAIGRDDKFPLGVPDAAADEA